MVDKHLDQKNAFCNPTSVLQAALEQIEIFTKMGAVHLEVSEEGKIIASNAPSALDKIKGLVRSFVGPVFSEKVRIEQQRKISQIKQQLLNARDIIQSHSLLIEKLNEGDVAEQKWAKWALEAITDYNAVVSEVPVNEKSSGTTVFNFERNQLLLDEEIKGKAIRLPHAISIKFDSNPEQYKAKKTFSEVSHTLFNSDVKKASIQSPKPKKMDQLMVDTFRMKGIRKIQQHWNAQYPIAEIILLVQQTPISIDETNHADQIHLRQVLEIIPGSIMILTGLFKKHSSDSKLMSIPILEDFHINLEFIQTGFPHTSQHTGWVLANALIDAQPLRMEQTPLFEMLESRKKKVAKGLLFDPVYINQAKSVCKSVQIAAEADVSRLIERHRKLHESIIDAAEMDSKLDSQTVLDDFYTYIQGTASCFNVLSQLQEQISTLIFEKPAQKLQDLWLNGYPQLRLGTFSEKLLAAKEILSTERESALAELKQDRSPVNAFMSMLVEVLGNAGQTIILQHMSEKIGFAPPLLSNFERKLQTCAFQQQLNFLDQFDEQSVTNFESNWTKDIEIFCVDAVDDLGLASELTNELEFYFNSRFYSSNGKQQ